MDPTPPPGGDDNKGPVILASIWTLTSVALITVVARLYGRFKLTRSAGWDDFFIVISMVFGILYSGLCTWAVMLGNGRHPYYLGPATSMAIKASAIAFIPGIIAFSIPKIAVACLLIRLMSPSRLQKRILLSLSISCVLIASLCAIFIWVQCTPSSGLWDPTVNATCWNPSVLINYSIFAGTYSACVDFYLAIYPMVVLYSLQMSRKKKVGLSLVLGVGLSATAVAIYKNTALGELYDHVDYTYATSNLLIVASAESNVLILAACLPTLRPLYLLARGREISSGGRSSAKQRRDDYKLHSVSKKSNSAPVKDIYNIDAELARDDESEEGILPPNRIRATYDVDVKSNVSAEGRSQGGDQHTQSFV
ncbi:hypothetical protein MMC18_007865 [Xylographa bjoerkii]|nr:hypothetical protein [Xylographa bjoerkii]